MAKSNEINERDYGRRTYASKKKYEEQRKLATDFSIGVKRGSQKHSEFKKPYLPDESYPEMEMFNIPNIPPVWPREPPDDPITVEPIDPGGPIPPRKGPPDKDLPPFLGCTFWRGAFKPNPIRSGEYSIGKLWIGTEDYIDSIKCEGPGRCTYGLAECNKKETVKFSGYKAQQTGAGSCTIVVWADATPDPKKGNTITIIVKMRSGMQCATTVDIEPCPAEIPLEWDTTISPATIGRASRVTIAVKGGAPPFNWSVSGNDFYLDFPKTAGRTNVLSTGDVACGTGNVTVIDACGEVVTGQVRCTSGQWVIHNDMCSCPGPWMYSQNMEGYWRFWREVGGCYMHYYIMGTFSYVHNCGDCFNYCTPVYQCDPIRPCDETCISNVLEAWLPLVGATLYKAGPWCYTDNSWGPDNYACACARSFQNKLWEC